MPSASAPGASLDPHPYPLPGRERERTGGIHYRFDVDEGYAIARTVSAKAADRPFTPLGR